MKIAVIGASGFLGSNLAFFFGEAFGIEVIGFSRTRSDLFAKWIPYSNPAKLTTDLRESHISHVINCAAVTSHEKAMLNPDEAHKVNASLAEDIATVASELGIGLCHISTDAVYSGFAQALYSEEAPDEPQTIYGESKLKGEQRVLRRHPHALIARTNFFGWSPEAKTGILDFFYQRLKSDQKTTGFTDYRVSSLYAGHLAQVLRDLLMSSESGVFNIGAREPMSKYDFGLQVAETFDFDSSLIQTGSIHDDSTLSTRGLFLGLETKKVTGALGRVMPSTLEGLEQAKEDQEEIFRWFSRQI